MPALGVGLTVALLLVWLILRLLVALWLLRGMLTVCGAALGNAVELATVAVLLWLVSALLVPD